ncbi:MAG TPA: hypothetical protein VFX96_10010 [Pyrinomonadaceae bacterium]|nr:hypothetical protein [Pyrinomonadaceae bacterium]
MTPQKGTPEMYCPKCSQPQATDDVRFCSRCGLPLEGVALVLANGGMLPDLPQGGELPEPSPKLRGVRQGGKMILLGMLVVPLVILFLEGLNAPEEPAVAAAVIFFLGGIVRMLYALLFQDGPLRRSKQTKFTPATYAPAPPLADRNWARTDSALPPARGEAIPTDAYTPPRATTESLRPPPSVAEGTTRLLDNE